jgi:phytoene dehydrogenase-like protein
MSKLKSAHIFVSPANLRQRDCIIVGGGHNGLITAAYLAKAGLDVLVAERRHCVGGAAVTEEIVPGFKFSRASYLAGLLRPQIISDLELPKYGFKYLKRNPSSFTPTLSNSKYGGKYLILGSDSKENWNSIAQFSKRDADRYEEYEEFLNKVRDLVQPIIDSAPPNVFEGNLRERMHSFSTILTMGSLAFKYRDILPYFYELMTGPASLILDRS